MNQTIRSCTFLIVAGVFSVSSFAGESLPFGGRISLFGLSQTATYDDGTKTDFSELTAWISIRSETADEGGLEYEFDVRSSTYPSSSSRDDRTRIYDAWVGGRTAGGRLKIRLGQMWLNDLGGLGSVGGVMAEYKMASSDSGQLRFGLFGGLEPHGRDTEYVDGVTKGGAWIAFDGTSRRRHVLGYVQIRDESLTERSVLTTTNFVRTGTKFHLYQAAEFDLSGPGGEGSGGLNYVFGSVRYRPSRVVELLGNYRKGKSIDSRSITQDILNGRPIDQRSLDGYLYESVGGRITVEVMRNLRIYAGYSSDRSNREDQASGRITAGLWASNIAGSGIDLTVSDNRMDRPDRAYDAWYVSLGRGFGPRVYLSTEYATSLSVIRLTEGDGTVIETRPETDRYGVHGVLNIGRSWSLLVDFEELRDDVATDQRAQLGLTYRF